jgi:multicomponent Na+:H+ antiporter subunit D
VSLLTFAPPALLLVVAAVAALAGRRAVHVAGALAAALAVPWVLTVPAGDHLAARFLGFDVVLFAVDPVSRAVGGVLAFVAVANVAYAYGTGTSARQLATALVYVGAALGAVFAGDWLTLVVWWELLALAATALLWQSPGAVRAGYRYAVYHQLGGMALVAGVLLHYAGAGSFLFDAGLTGLPGLLALLGVGLNVGFLGLHVWVVDAYPRPDVATTVILSGVTTKVGVYALVRVLPGQRLTVAYVGATMVLVGVTLAVLQTDVRRLLSYHIVSQVGYMVAAIGLATAAGRAGGLAHLVNNVVYKTLLFMVAGAVVVGTGRESLKKVGGLGRAMPRTTAAFAVAALAIAGIPGFSGYVSKGFVTAAAEAAGADPLWWALQVGAVGTVVSFVKFGYYAFFRDAPESASASDGAASSQVGPSVTVAYALLALPCVVFGLAPDALVGLLPAGASTATLFGASKLTAAAAITVAGVAAFALSRRPLSHVTPVPDLDALYHPVGRLMLDGGAGVVSRVARTLDRGGARLVGTATAALSAPDALTGLGIRRATIGTGVFLLAVVTGVFLLVALLG